MPKLRWLVGMVVLVYLIAALMVPQEVLRVFSYALVFGVGTVIAVTWGPHAWLAIRSGARWPEEKGVLAVWGFFISIGLFLGWAMVYRLLDRPAWMTDSPIQTFFIWLCAASGSLFLVLPNTLVRGPVPRRNIYALIAALVVSFIAAGLAALD